MTPAEHWEEADTIVTGDRCDYGCAITGCVHEMAYLARAQVHATLALAAGPLGISIGEEPTDPESSKAASASTEVPSRS